MGKLASALVSRRGAALLQTFLNVPQLLARWYGELDLVGIGERVTRVLGNTGRAGGARVELVIELWFRANLWEVQTLVGDAVLRTQAHQLVLESRVLIHKLTQSLFHRDLKDPTF